MSNLGHRPTISFEAKTLKVKRLQTSANGVGSSDPRVVETALCFILLMQIAAGKQK